jgi:hypothetical protein
MYRVKWIKDVYDNDVKEFHTLDEAMNYAKQLDITVEIKTPDYTVVGKFGVDSVENLILPNGAEYGYVKRRYK